MRREPEAGAGDGVEAVDRPALEADRAGVLADLADDLLDQRRLAGAVRADQRVDLAAAQVER